MRVTVWGARGSIPAPGPETMRYGGNTSCVELTLSDGSTLILDAGTGIRNLGRSLPCDERPVTILLTHLHMDHIQGLMFFAPAFSAASEITIWGPASPGTSLQERIARYISAPLTPLEVRELPSRLCFREALALQWTIGCAQIRAQAVNHRGPTLGYRIQDGEQVVCYIPDHEPGLGAPIDALGQEWISGVDLAHGADLLIHDCQYTDREYPAHVGWGHCPLSHALTFADRVAAARVLLFHHDPLHDDDTLDTLGAEARERWVALGGNPGAIDVAAERCTIELSGAGRSDGQLTARGAAAV
jgi:phosphoribosyl 1,2-cyclic phosphodiesterase